MPYPLINSTAINTDDSGPEDTTTIGFMRTRYGDHTVVAVAGENQSAGPATLGVATQYGTASVSLGTTVLGVLSAVRSTRMGTPTIMGQGAGVGQPALTPAPMGVITRMGTASVRTHKIVEAESIAPYVSCGTPNVRAVLIAASMRTTAFGTPVGRFAAHAPGLQSTQFGIPRVVRIARAPSLPGPRYGVPSIAGFAFAGTEGFCSTEYGTHSINRSAHALPCAPATRYGRHTISRDSQC